MQKMNLFLVLSLSFLFSPLVSMAKIQAPNLPALTSHNFLIGAQMGYARQKQDVITHLTVPEILIDQVYDFRETTSDSGVLLGLLTGWQWRWQRVMLGLEGHLDFQSFEENRQFTFTSDVNNAAEFEATTLYDRGPMWGLSARAGYFVTPFFMPYLRLGVQLSRDEIDYRVGSDSDLADFNTRREHVRGVILGIGAEFPTYIGSSTIRAEYNFTRTESLHLNDTTLPIIGNYKFHRPEANMAKISWVWNFI